MQKQTRLITALIFIFLIALILTQRAESTDRTSENRRNEQIFIQEISFLKTQNIALEYELEKAKELKDVLLGSNYIGEFDISYYCSCEKCCGKADGITYTGTQATEGRTIAVDPNIIPLGSTVIIDGQTYIAEDIGGSIKSRKIDIFVSDHQRALDLGKTVKEVYLIVQNK